MKKSTIIKIVVPCFLLFCLIALSINANKNITTTAVVTATQDYDFETTVETLLNDLNKNSNESKKIYEGKILKIENAKIKLISPQNFFLIKSKEKRYYQYDLIECWFKEEQKEYFKYRYKDSYCSFIAKVTYVDETGTLGYSLDIIDFIK